MSYTSEHQRMQPVLELARRLDIATNPDPQAIFEAGNGGFQVWCTPQDRPQGWKDIQMVPGAFSKPCEYVGSVCWRWEGERIVALAIETAAYALADQKPDQYCNLPTVAPDSNRSSIFNREADLEWLKEKITWLFGEAAVPLLPSEHEPAVPSIPDTGFFLVHYVSDADQYLVIVSPGTNLEEFCREGYLIAQSLGIPNAGNFPLDVVLHAQQEFFERDSEPDEGPLVEQYENSTRMHEDNWLEAVRR